ncbi:MAG TPA: hypothetical protein VGK78_04150 [Nocardioides sp.]|uniref:hypothetical protein n=1 Tax=Nocardioides sp. TaxID=35761 RepID=UPI002F414F24
MVEPVHVFWGLVAILAMAAACNHGWHHTRQNHLASRLARASYAHAVQPLVVSERPATIEVESSPGA